MKVWKRLLVTVYKDMNADIKAFKVYGVQYNRLIRLPEIVDIHSYNHQSFQLHHYIKAQDYKRNMKWYIENRIEEKLILMPTLMHEHLESPIYGLSDEAFYRKYRIEKEKLLFNKKKWIDKQVKGENYGKIEIEFQKRKQRD